MNRLGRAIGHLQSICVHQRALYIQLASSFPGVGPRHVQLFVPMDRVYSYFSRRLHVNQLTKICSIPNYLHVLPQEPLSPHHLR